MGTPHDYEDSGPSSRDPAAAPTSDRLQLEVELLTGTSEQIVVPQPVTTPGEPRYTVLAAVAEADLRSYIRECLRERTDLRVAEADPGEPVLEAIRRLRPALVIAEVSAIPGAAAASVASAPAHGAPNDYGLPPLPLLLIGDEAPELLATGHPRPGTRMVFLPQPFNARRLLDAVERLLHSSS
jgi:hypothetical protein